MKATHGHPRDYTACGERLAIRHATPKEKSLIVCVGGMLFTCPKHGPVYMEVFIS